MKLNFLGLPDSSNPRVALVPLPFEFTTSWLKGTKFAPIEILKVSPNLEFFDEEDLITPHEVLGFYTEEIIEFSPDFERALAQVEELAKKYAEKRLFAIYIGGEHTVSFPILKVYQKYYPCLKVLHLDAHLDQRDEYLGSKLNHATVMRRVKELNLPVLSVGIRSASEEEKEILLNERELIILAKDFIKDEEASLKKVSEFLGEGPSYLSLDVDVFDPSQAPGVGTPEPGGLSWYQVLEILKLFVKANPVAMDIVEVRPMPTLPITEYLVAKLILKISAYLAKSLP
jgi:agmatinase